MGHRTAKSVASQPEHRHVALNASQGGETIAALCFELPAPGADAAPRTITLIPAPDADGVIRGIDGRSWRMKDAAKIVAAFTRPRAITENHAGMLAAPAGGGSPAHGWIETIRADNGAIVGDVAWTPRGTAALQARDYRFLSPEFQFDAKTSEILALVGASLVNDPNFPQLALNREQSTEHTPMLTAILRALGLADTASADDAVVAINALKTERQTALNQAQHPDPTKFVPAETHEVALNRATAAEAELKKVKDTQLDADITAAVDQAQAAGKIAPANRDFYLAMCRTEGGLEKFREFAGKAPVMFTPTDLDKKPDADKGADGLTENQLAICRQMGMDPKTYAASLKASA
jgi:phage I-like protein